MKRILTGGVVLGLVPVINFFFKDENYAPVKTSYTSNPALKNLLDQESWPGTPLDQRGLFINDEHTFWPRFSDLMKWQTEANPYKAQKKEYLERLKVVNYNELENMPQASLIWLGHASFLLKFNGKKILIDPVLDSPSFLMKRYSELPFAKESLENIDYILISHDHRDHCDEDSIKLLAKQNPEATWLCGLGLEKLLQKWTGTTAIQAAGWYQRYHLKDEGLKISYLPSRHWSRRGLADTNTTLWGGFMIESGETKIYFGGDTGYGNHVKKVREIFGEIDYYLVGIGAFAPRWFMGPSHMHPEDAAKTANELGAKNIIPMHYGTFDLSDEPLLEPGHIITKLKKENAFSSNLVMPAVGELVRV